MKNTKLLSGASLIIVLLQSACTAVFAISGLRVAIGLGALAAAGGLYTPARGFHQDAIRIPMLCFGALGAIVNLAVLAWRWKLRNAPSAQWRRRPFSAKEKRSEALQIALSALALVLVVLEMWTHSLVHRKPPVHGGAAAATPVLSLSGSRPNQAPRPGAHADVC